MFERAHCSLWMGAFLPVPVLAISLGGLAAQGQPTDHDATVQLVAAQDSSDVGHTLHMNALGRRVRRARAGVKGSEVLQHLERPIIRRDRQSRRSLRPANRSRIATSRRADGLRPSVDRVATDAAREQRSIPASMTAPLSNTAATASTSVATVFTTDFEAGEGFAAGFIDGQVGWSAGGGSLVEPQIDSINPSSGAQHLRFKDAPDAGVTLAISPDFGPQPTGVTTTSMDVFMACDDQGEIPAGQECSLNISGKSISEGSVETWKIFFRKGFITIGGNPSPGDIRFVSNEYRTLTVCDDPIAGRTEFYYGDALVAVIDGGSHLPGTRIEQIVLTSSTVSNRNGVIDVDNITVETGRSSACRGVTCGDGVHALGEDCDRFDDAACPGLCTLDCTCPTPICGNDIREPGNAGIGTFEDCDGADDSLCPGNCFPPGHANECRCHIPSEVVTGFEAANGFSPGFIEDQADWEALLAKLCLEFDFFFNICIDEVVTPTSLVEAHVDTANPSSGTQHLRLSFDPSPEVLIPGMDVEGFNPSDVRLGALSRRVLLDAPDTPSTTSVDVSITGVGGATYTVTTKQPGFWTVQFRGDGRIMADFVDTGFDWVPGVYRNLTVCFDPLRDRSRYFYDGRLIHVQEPENSPPFTLGVRSILFGSDNKQNSPTEHADFDNFSHRAGLIGICALEGCGNNIVEINEFCDGTDDDVCPGLCQGDCTCPTPVCGNGATESGEQCDGADDSNCPGLCDTSCCSCPAPVCGNSVVEEGEVCDGTSDSACLGGCFPPGGASECTCSGIPYTVGFETSEGFNTLPPLDGQGGWITDFGDFEPQVSDANPAAGTQHVRFDAFALCTRECSADSPFAFESCVTDDDCIIDEFGPGECSTGAIGGVCSLDSDCDSVPGDGDGICTLFPVRARGPDLRPVQSNTTTTSIDVSIGAIGGADYSVTGESLPGGSLAWDVRFRSNGSIEVQEGGGASFVDTGATWTAGVYKTLVVCDDPDLGNTDYFYGGVLIYSQITQLAGQGVDQIALSSNSEQTTEVGDMDNLSVVPGLSGTCTAASTCGNNTRDTGERCDGTDASACPGLCNSVCACPLSVCGNDTLEPGEECDGTDDGTCPGQCSSVCKCDGPRCGNDVLEAGEDCDRSDDDACVGLCRDDCTCPAPICGNNIAESGEQCDGTDAPLCPGQCVACACPPVSNDECANAITIPCPGSATVNNCTATRSAFDSNNLPCSGLDTGHGSVWFKFTATDTSARIRTDLNSTAPDSIFAGVIFNQALFCDLSLRQQRGCSTDEGVGLNGDICMQGLTPGDTYYIFLVSKDESTCGSYTVDIECPCPAAACTNNVKEPGEDCDGTDDAACIGLCQGDCTCPAPVCGNNTIEEGEACDGTADAACPGACQSNCQCSTCGDGILGGSEQCDGSDDAACPGNCTGDCVCAICGDNDAAGSEECDGTDDSACPESCLGDCTCAFCGDGITEGGEQCDSTDDAACPGECTSVCTCAVCGDGDVNRSVEQCDGSNDSACPGLCLGDCTCPTPVCGNGSVELGEECEAGNDGNCPGQCDTTCCTCQNAICGNGVVEFGEECDGTADATCPGLCVAAGEVGACACAPAFGTGFESSDGFSAGLPIDGQQGWTASSTDARIDTANPFPLGGGTQHLRLGTAVGMNAITPSFFNSITDSPTTMTVDMFLQPFPTSTVELTSNTLGSGPSIKWAVRFAGRDIFVSLDGNTFINTFKSANAGNYRTVTVCHDPQTGSLKVAYTCDTGGCDPEVFSLVGAFSDDNDEEIVRSVRFSKGGAAGVEAVDFDNLRLVPVWDESVCGPRPNVGVCGNDVAEAREACDGTDNTNCPTGVPCRPDCTCPPSFCGNDIVESPFGVVGAEECDGTDDDACPGLCQSDCTCPTPFCGNNAKEFREECDGLDDGNCDGGLCLGDCTCDCSNEVQVFGCSDTVATLFGDPALEGNDCRFFSGAEDVWEIQITETGAYNFSMCSGQDCLADPHLVLTDQCCDDSNIIAINDDGCACDSIECAALDCVQLDPGTYYLHVEHSETGGGGGPVGQGGGPYEVQIDCCDSTCGNSLREANEQCDGNDDEACVGLCQGDCTCPAPSCGNGVIEAGEICDGANDAACPTLCQGDCTCPAPVCGNGVLEAGETCDGANDAACPGLCAGDCTCSCGDFAATFGCPEAMLTISGDATGEVDDCNVTGGGREHIWRITITEPGQYTFDMCDQAPESCGMGAGLVLTDACCDNTNVLGIQFESGCGNDLPLLECVELVPGDYFLHVEQGFGNPLEQYRLAIDCCSCGNGMTEGAEECDGLDDLACPGNCTADCDCAVCGDGVTEGLEECDGADDFACPGNCTGDCDCATCGDGVAEGLEECDGSDDSACAGSCLGDCTCPPPVCGNDILEAGETCDGTDDAACPLTCSAACDCLDCETAVPGAGEDCNTNGIVDACEIAKPLPEDVLELNADAAVDTFVDLSVALAASKAGTWVAAWTRRDGSFENVFYSRSVDEGGIWSAPAALSFSVGTRLNSEPEIATDGLGNWMVVWQTNDETITGDSTDRDIVMSTSVDDGQNWSTPSIVFSNFFRDDRNPDVATDGMGTWMVVWASNDQLDGSIGTDFDILFATSGDLGTTWSSPAALNIDATSDNSGFALVHDDNPIIRTDSAGVWLAAWTEDGDFTPAFVNTSRSTDGGATWGSPDALGEPAGDVSLATDRLGRWIVAWHSRDDLGGTVGTDNDILTRHSTDNGVTFGATEALNRNADADGTASDFEVSIAADGLGGWMAVWSSFLVGDTDLLFATRPPGSDFWTFPRTLNSNAGVDTGSDRRSAVATDGRGRWMAAWDGLGSGSDNEILYSGIDVALDCNINGVLDSCEIAGNPGLDGNGDGVLDECVPGCGNGVLEAGEECDGNDDAACPGQCQVNCTCPAGPVCGNNTTEAGEECDGTDDATCPGDCTGDCDCAVCGDNVAEGSEECDTGGESAACDIDCTFVTCGDNLANTTAGEVCDGTDDTACPGQCQGDCTCPGGPVCGNNVTEVGEACDGTDDAACPGLCRGDCTCGIIFVDANATGRSTSRRAVGSSWCQAFVTLQPALAAAVSGEVVRVADGTYTPDPSGLGDPREATFQLTNGVTVEGGYAGCGAPDPDARDVELFETLLTGDLNGDDGTVGNAENSYHVVNGSGVDATAVLDGFTITAGNATGAFPDSVGGGMILGRFNSVGNATVTACTFSSNSAMIGGGLANLAGSAPTLTNCNFMDNSAAQNAGAMYSFDVFQNGSSPILTGCTFSNNSADVGGGRGGAIYIEKSNDIVTDCTFTANTAAEGGALQVLSGSPTFTNCSFQDNTARFGGGLSCVFIGALALNDCLFSGNAADDVGGAILAADGGTVTATNCTVSGNTAGAAGGGVRNANATSILVNGVFWGNADQNGSNTGESAQISNGGGTVDVTYSLIQGLNLFAGGTGNIAGDPLFVDEAGGNFRLSSSSPAIDAGDNTAPGLVGILLDLDANNRFVDVPGVPDTGNGPPPIVDMGVYEVQNVVSTVEPPKVAPFPHDRRKNRYITFDPNKTENDGINVAFKVELTAITLGSCNGPAGSPAKVDFCRADRGADDCNTCAGAPAENSCIDQPIDCSTGGTCTPTGETCVNDAPNAGGSNVGTVWWVGPEQNGVHLLVSQSFRKESTNWANPVHAGDCEIVPEARYGIRAVDAGSGSESAELLVETTLFAGSSSSWWGDCVGPLRKFCGGDIRTPECAGDAECTAPETCDRAWTLPDGSVNFDDVNAALALVAPGPTSVAPDTTWVDLHGNASGTPGSQNFDPPNFVLNFSDIGQILSGFGGFPYKGYDPADCP